MSETAPNPGEPAAQERVDPPRAAARKLTRRRRWLYRMLSMTVVPLLLFGVLELVLRVAGYGYPTDFFLDGSRTERPGVLIENQEFNRWVFPGNLGDLPAPFPFVLPAVKPARTYRVFVLGESAALGYPEPSSSFARVLEVLLRARYPETHFEVVNTAMVVYMGNNEVVGPFGAAGVFGPYTPSTGVIRANLAVKRTRAGQLLDGLLHGLGKDNQEPRRWEGLSAFRNSHVTADDGRLPHIHANFRDNLRGICTAAAEAGVPAIVCTVPVNLKDCSPFGSAHAAGLAPEQAAAWERAYQDGVRLETGSKFAEALGRYEEAARRDDRFADLAFRQGRCLAALGKAEEARHSFVRARDLDSLRFRADATVNETIRAVVGEMAAGGVRLADAERAFKEASPQGIPGEELFLEHVHLNFAGNYLLARTVFRTVEDLASVSLGPQGKAAESLSERACAEQLAYTPWNELKVATKIREMLGTAPFTGQLDRVERAERWKVRVAGLQDQLQGPESHQKVLAQYERAIERSPEDWIVRFNYGQLLADSGAPAKARRQFGEVLERCRHSSAAHCQLAGLLVKAGRAEEAVPHYREALRTNGNYAEAHFGLARALADQGKTAEARAIFEERCRRAPDRAEALAVYGLFLLEIGQRDEARTRLTEALRCDPDHVMAHVHLGDVAIKQGKTAEAIEHYEAALRLRPEWPELTRYLARLRQGAAAEVPVP
jgi:tetratricopeptide (TPR) repeat protein